MYKIETHLHTKPASTCGKLEPEEMIRLYHEAGYSTVFVSDHFAEHHFAQWGEDCSWQEKVGHMYEGYLRAKAVGERLGMHVLFSPELSLGANHFLLYHADLAFLTQREDYFQMTPEEFYPIAKAHGITVIQAHPFRDEKCTPYPLCADGFEVINSNPRHENFDEKTIALAKEYPLLLSAGSDAHRLEDIGGAAVVSPYEITTTAEYLALLKSGKAKLMKWGEIIL